ncbi:MAG TPA: YceI family protein [Micromonosporaceae bacterium]|nr:YceI family protein [Micromonosporaceae bacterium]
MSTDTGTAVAAGVYEINAADSHVRFRTSHSFGVGPVAGTFAMRDGTITVAADPRASTVTARVDAASFTTDKPKRDADVRSKRFLNADEHPELVFTSDRLVRDGDRWLLHGRLTVRGRTAPIVLELDSGTSDVAGCRFRAHARVDRYAFRVGLRGIAARYTDVEFDIVGSRVG